MSDVRYRVMREKVFLVASDLKGSAASKFESGSGSCRCRLDAFLATHTVRGGRILHRVFHNKCNPRHG